MTITFTLKAWSDFEYWLENDPGTAEKIRDLIKDNRRTPFHGLGKPEALRYNLKGFWSRRITDEHRLVYYIEGNKLDQKCCIVQCRYYYHRI